MGDPTDETLPPPPDDTWGRFARARAAAAREVWVRPRHLAEQHPRIEHLLPDEALELLRRWVGERDGRDVTETIHRMAFGSPADLDPVRRREIIERELGDAFRTGALIVHAERIAPGRPGTIPVQPETPPPQPGSVRPTTAWIEVHLVDERQTPVVEEVVLVVDPGGGRQHVRTDAQGLARLGGVDPGICDVSFPRIDGREWARRGEVFTPGTDAIAHVHAVQPRECMARIGYRHGFRSGDTLWRHACNAELRDTGRDPDILWPGDRVNILVRDDRIAEAETGKRHHFVVKTAMRWLRLVLHDVFRRPLAEVPCVLAIRGRTPVTSTTKADGLLEELIPPSATEATITAGDYVWHVAIADLLPVEQVPDQGDEGTLRRLRNLGCPAGRDLATRRSRVAGPGSEHSSEAAQSTTASFDADVFMHQLRVGWAASGDLDDATRALVIDEYPDPRLVEARIVMVTNLDVQPQPPLRPDPEPDAADAAPTEIQGGRPVPRAGCHQAHIYDLDFRFDADGVLLDSAWRRARVVEPTPASAVWAPRRFGIPAQPRRVASPAGQVPPGNTIIDSALLKLVQLRARYL